MFDVEGKKTFMPHEVRRHLLKTNRNSKQITEQIRIAEAAAGI